MSEHPQPSTPKPRLQALSDMIFALALTIGAISLTGSRASDIIGVESGLLAFGFSFLILISVWLRYSALMSVLPVDTSMALALNLLMLFCVSVEPHLFNTMTSANTLVFFSQASTFYAIDLGALYAILGVFTHQLTLEERGLIPKALMSRYKVTRNLELFTAIIFLITATPPFGIYFLGNLPIRIWLWFTPFIIYPMRRLRRHMPRNP